MGRRARRRIALRLLPFVFVMFVICIVARPSFPAPDCPGSSTNRLLSDEYEPKHWEGEFTNSTNRPPGCSQDVRCQPL